MSTTQNVVGLFGTCGSSTWRQDVAIPILEAAGVEYFNPVVENWTEECMAREAEHAASDKVILLVITGETTGIASMAELGFLILQSHYRGQKLVVVLQDMPTEIEPGKDEKGGDFRPNKTRALLRNHLAKLPAEVRSSVVLCESVEEAAQEAARLMSAS